MKYEIVTDGESYAIKSTPMLLAQWLFGEECKFYYQSGLGGDWRRAEDCVRNPRVWVTKEEAEFRFRQLFGAKPAVYQEECSHTLRCAKCAKVIGVTTCK